MVDAYTGAKAKAMAMAMAGTQGGSCGKTILGIRMISILYNNILTCGEETGTEREYETG